MSTNSNEAPQFAEGIRSLAGQEFPPIEEICICLREDYRVRELAEHFTAAEVVFNEA